MLCRLLQGVDKERFDPAVISLADRGTLGDRVEALGIAVHPIGMKPGVPGPISLGRLLGVVRRLKPDLIQGWMYHGNLAAQLAGSLAARRIPVLWNIRQSLYSLDFEKPGTVAAIKLGARLSKLPARILNNSQTSATQHEAIGYQAGKTCIILNGFDTELFVPSAEARRSVRSELGVAENTLLVGLVGRYHPIKDHANFLHAARLLLETHLDVQFVLSGKGISWKNGPLSDLIYDLGIVERVHLLGERLDMPRLTASFDIASSSSYGEGFSNVIGEAMSCGVPCVVTDVSDSPKIVVETGKVVPPHDPEAFAAACRSLIDLGPSGRRALGEAARLRVIENFSLSSVVAQYEALYTSVLAQQATERLRAKGLVAVSQQKRY